MEVVWLINQIINWQVNFINQLLENSKKEKFIHFLETTFGFTDLADMQLLKKYHKGIKYLLYAIDLFSKYTWVFPLKDKKRTSIVNALKYNLRR